jgi:hypothetical protein
VLSQQRESLLAARGQAQIAQTGGQLFARVGPVPIGHRLARGCDSGHVTHVEALEGGALLLATDHARDRFDASPVMDERPVEIECREPDHRCRQPNRPPGKTPRESDEERRQNAPQ